MVFNGMKFIKVFRKINLKSAIFASKCLFYVKWAALKICLTSILFKETPNFHFVCCKKRLKILLKYSISFENVHRLTMIISIVIYGYFVKVKLNCVPTFIKYELGVQLHHNC